MGKGGWGLTGQGGGGRRGRVLPPVTSGFWPGAPGTSHILLATSGCLHSLVSCIHSNMSVPIAICQYP